MSEYLHSELTSSILDSAITVHRSLGPGLLESAYEACLCHELVKREHAVERQKPLTLRYDGLDIECGYRLDLIVDQRVIVELKATEAIEPIHEAQVHTYLRLSGLRVGLLLNFNVVRMRDGIKRIVL